MHGANLDALNDLLPTGLLPTGFVEHVAGHTIADIFGAGILASLGLLASWQLRRVVRCHWRAAQLRRASTDAFTIIRCSIANDHSGSLGNEISIRLETAFRAFADSNRPFQVIEFPLQLPNDEGTESYDHAMKTAKRWLDATNGDILIWGKYLKGGSVGLIRLIGKNRKKGIVEARRIDFDKNAERFDDALALAIAHEAAELTHSTLSDPEGATLDSLRTAAVKIRRLAQTDAPALSDKWRYRIAEDYRRLLQEITRRTPDTGTLLKLEEETRAELTATDKRQEPRRYATTALRMATLIRKRNWFGRNATELDEASNLLSQTIPLLESRGEIEHAAASALERMLIRQQELIFVDDEEANSEALYKHIFSEASRLVNMAASENLRCRLVAASLAYPRMKELSEFSNLEHGEFSRLFEFVDQIISHLDNGEVLSMARELSRAIGADGDRLKNVNLWRVNVEIIEAIAASRASWTADERCHLTSMIGESSARNSQRLRRISGEVGARPYYDRAKRTFHEIDQSYDWEHLSNYRYVDLRTLLNYATDTWEPDRQLYRSVAALRICAGSAANRFPRLQASARKRLAVALNNCSVVFNSLEAAQEALELLPEDSADAYVQYIATFSAWQVARLTENADPAEWADRAKRAHSMGERALAAAIRDDDMFLASLNHEILRMIEAAFPDLAVDLEAASG